MDSLFALRCRCCGAALRQDKKNNRYICDYCGTEFQKNTDETESKSFVIVAGVLEKYVGSSPLVEIPEGVSIIGNRCFAGMELIESIAVPNGVVKIGDDAFRGCSRLKYVSFPETLSEIGPNAFKDSGLKDVLLPDSVTSIGKDAFMGCSSLEKAVLPKFKILSLERTFKQCSSLRSVDCNLSNFCLSFKPSNEAKKKGDTRPTLFDAFQATPYLSSLKEKQSNRQCVICGSGIGLQGTCSQCGAKHADLSFGCYVATCVYGSYDCPQVWTLRRYRDSTLGATWYGRTFVRLYYAVSPTLVRWFGEKKWFRTFWKGRLDGMVKRLKQKGVADTPYQDRIW